MGESWRMTSHHPYGNGGNENFKAEDARCVKKSMLQNIVVTEGKVGFSPWWGDFRKWQ